MLMTNDRFNRRTPYLPGNAVNTVAPDTMAINGNSSGDLVDTYAPDAIKAEPQIITPPSPPAITPDVDKATTPQMDATTTSKPPAIADALGAESAIPQQKKDGFDPLPLLYGLAGLAEVIGTKGKSQGDFSMGLLKNYQGTKAQQKELEKEARAKELADRLQSDQDKGLKEIAALDESDPLYNQKAANIIITRKMASGKDALQYLDKLTTNKKNATPDASAQLIDWINKEYATDPVTRAALIANPKQAQAVMVSKLNPRSVLYTPEGRETLSEAGARGAVKGNPALAAIAGITPGSPTTTGDYTQSNPALDQQVKLIESGQASPDMTEFKAKNPTAAMYVESKLAKDGFNPLLAHGDLAYWNNPQTRRNLQVMNVLSEQMPKLVASSNAMKRMNIPLLDKNAIEAARAAGNVEAAKYLASQFTTIEDIAKGIAGGNALTNDQQKLAQEILYQGATPAQLEALASTISDGVKSRKLTIYSQGGQYGKVSAKNDPYLENDIKNKILNGNIGISDSATAHPSTLAAGATKVIGGKTYVKKDDGKWYLQ